MIIELKKEIDVHSSYLSGLLVRMADCYKQDLKELSKIHSHALGYISCLEFACIIDSKESDNLEDKFNSYYNYLLDKKFKSINYNYVK